MTPIHPFPSSYSLQLQFQPYPFYGPSPGYHTPPSYGLNTQYQPSGASTIPGHECLSCSVTSPFVKELLDYEIPNTAKLLTLKTYNGTTDPDSHIDTYEWTMTSLKLDERFWCMYFPTTLDGNADTWFKTLRSGNISNFFQLKYLFLTNFMQLRKYKGDSHSIIGCKQKEGETVREYFTRFINATLDVLGHDEGLIAGAFTWGLFPGPLSQKLMGKKPLTRAKLKERVERYLRQEDGEAAKQAYLNAMTARHHNPGHTDFLGEVGTAAKREDHGLGSDRLPRMTDMFIARRCTRCQRSSSQPNRQRTEMEEKQLKGDLVEIARSLRAKFDVENAKNIPREGVQPKEISMIWSKRSRGEQQTEQGTTRTPMRMLTFSVQDPRPEGWRGDDPLVIQASIRDVTIRRVYVDTGSSSDIIYEHYFWLLPDRWKDNLRPMTGRLVGSGSINHAWSHEIRHSNGRSHSTGYSAERIAMLYNYETSREAKKLRHNPEKGKEVINEEHPDQPVSIGCDLPSHVRRALVDLLKRYKHVFVWTPTDMVGVERKVIEHKLVIKPGAKEVKQKKRVQGGDRNRAINVEVAKLAEARIVREAIFPTWIANPVMVRKQYVSWRMCIDSSDLNKACP
uniref:Retrotransposon gag domain-containing protein n=1 Tax=Lactuca sativa TaxID=4236 RepID=A0A9R1XIM9_LACSA|nr:hypothetical protein LSAT_V11C300135490 [Lactuca sativa]